jgi:hypothetical protein
MLGQRQVTSADGYRNRMVLCIMFLCLGILMSLPVSTVAQVKTVTINPNELAPFKFKLTRNLTSGRVRVGDYVQFQLIEDVKYPHNGGLDRDTIIAKDTPIYGQVVDRRHRFTAIKKGRFSIGKLWTTTVDGQRVELDIARPGMPSELCENKIPEKTREAERKAAKYQAEPKAVRKEEPKKEQNTALVPCINGRVYAGSFISNVPSALLAVATATTLVRVKDDNATNAVIAVTLADKIASQSGFSNIINGVDAEMEKDEIFDSIILITQPLVIKVPPPKDAKAAAGVRVGRFTATPPGYIVTDYFSDVVKYPIMPGQPSVYTGKVIERYEGQKVGSIMNMCEPQSLPDGWVLLETPVDPKVCPREPSDTTKGPTYRVILKTTEGALTAPKP